MEHSSVITWRDFITQSSCADLATTRKETPNSPLVVSILNAQTIPKVNASSATKKTTTRKRIKTESKLETHSLKDKLNI